MEQNKAERLNENVTEKMCSSDGNVIGKMTKGKRCHKWSRIKRLNENVTEKMCSSDGNVVGKMCSPADADTCGNSLLIIT